jgi:4-amino-4-deoxy-L-arabinose transferase-like glycosyltransferase
MESLYLIQLVGVVLVTAGLIALTAAAHVFGAPLSPEEKRRASDEWNRRRDAYRLPINLEAVASTIFFLGGIGILIWSKFSLCAFLAYWLPPLPALAKLLLSCR